MVVLMCSYHLDGVYTRQLSFFGNDKLGNACHNALKDQLQLDHFETKTSNVFNTFKQGNVQASRKQVAPLLKNFIETL
ncbi:unnamed protein product [Ambrosiozyma monospora]|uniref:Unnamed protein product n=1 Tax=Ambrosiozyma monospora TaxID=43982 RepID=A0ACB5TNC8_AMBMO|nr:unnamed protein product [Ambrosiozyma monospora]